MNLCRLKPSQPNLHLQHHRQHPLLPVITTLCLKLQLNRFMLTFVQLLLISSDHLILFYSTLSYSLTLAQIISPHIILSLSHLTSPHLSSLQLTLPHLTSPHFSLPHFTPPLLNLHHLTPPIFSSPQIFRKLPIPLIVFYNSCIV